MGVRGAFGQHEKAEFSLLFSAFFAGWKEDVPKTEVETGKGPSGHPGERSFSGYPNSLLPEVF